MSSYYGRPHPKKKKDPLTEDPFVRLTAYVPRNIFTIIEIISAEKKIPISRLIAYALYNEVEDSADPFRFDLSLPEDEYIFGKYEHEAELLRQYLMKVPGGIGLDQLIMLKEDIGMSPKKILLAYMELKESGRIEEYSPKSTFQYDESYKFIRLTGVSRAIMNRQRFKTVAGDATKYKKV